MMSKCKNKKIKMMNILKIIVLVQISAILYSFFTDFFIIPAAIYSGGFTGITQIIIYSIISPDDLLSRQLWFYIVYFLINLPLIIFGWLKISKQLSMITLFFICSQELWNLLWTSNLFHEFSIMPSMLQKNNQMGIFFFAFFGGALWAASNSIVYHAGGCGGGTDFIATYFSIYKNKSIGKFQRIIQIIILFIAITLEFIIHNYEGYSNIFIAFLNNKIFYASLVFAIVASITFDKCYNNTKKYNVIIENDSKFITKFLEMKKIDFSIVDHDILIKNLGWIDIKKIRKTIIIYGKRTNYEYNFNFCIIKNEIKKESIKYDAKKNTINKG